jgi:hypothetical protein
MKALIRITVAATLAAGAACTVQQTDVPGLSGPSEFATALSLSATPDTIRQDGVDSSSIVVTARDASGGPLAGLQLRLDILADGGPADFGTLSQRTVSTGADGRVRVTYTAPPAPPKNAPLGFCSESQATLPGDCVAIAATPVLTSYGSRPTETVLIHLVPAAVILPPVDPTAPTAAFAITQSSTPRRFLFNGGASTPVAGRTIVRYEWSWGDGESASRVEATEDHDYPQSGIYPVTLTVVDSAGVTGSVTQNLTVF